MYRILLLEAYSFLSPFPKLGNYLSRLSLMKKFYRVSIWDRSGQYSIMFYAKLSSTKVLFSESYCGSQQMQFLFKSMTLIIQSFRVFTWREVTLLFLSLISWMSGRLQISYGILVISLFEASIFVIGRHSHQFWSSKLISSM